MSRAQLNEDNIWHFFWSEHFFFSKPMLWLLFITNAAGTVYGYIWYGNQLRLTYETMDRWLLPFVPDSPTASLFFTLSLLFIIIDRSIARGTVHLHMYKGIRAFVDAFAVITSIKYGIWAVAMIAAGGAQGDIIVWQEWMLVVSHLGMALQVILFSRYMRFGQVSIVLVAIWVFINDYLDYHRMIYPWLPNILEDDLFAIEVFTVFLSLCGLLTANVIYKLRKKRIQ
jgi:uncharacterized membrane protein YpjA